MCLNFFYRYDCYGFLPCSLLVTTSSSFFLVLARKAIAFLARVDIWCVKVGEGIRSGLESLLNQDLCTITYERVRTLVRLALD